MHGDGAVLAPDGEPSAVRGESQRRDRPVARFHPRHAPRGRDFVVGDVGFAPIVVSGKSLALPVSTFALALLALHSASSAREPEESNVSVGGADGEKHPAGIFCVRLVRERFRSGDGTERDGDGARGEGIDQPRRAEGASRRRRSNHHARRARRDGENTLARRRVPRDGVRRRRLPPNQRPRERLANANANDSTRTRVPPRTTRASPRSHP